MIIFRYSKARVQTKTIDMNGRVFKFKEDISLFCKRTELISFFLEKRDIHRVMRVWNKIISFNESDDLFCTAIIVLDCYCHYQYGTHIINI